MKCRHCNADVTKVLIDLGSAPPSNAYLTKLTMRRPEKWFPLKVLVCEKCWLVQAEAYSRAAELFNEEYAYFSSFSDAWLLHSEKYVREAVNRFELTDKSFVIEVASNDGYLLQYVKEAGIPCLGIEPTASTASASRLKGIETFEEFFGTSFANKIATERGKADLMIANNVLAHVPDINDFVSGFAALLKPQGVATFEFPHLLMLIKGRQFDTIYHEHFSYLSLTTTSEILKANGLAIFDVQKIGTHGGSLRVFVQHQNTGKYAVCPSVNEILKLEVDAGMRQSDFYNGFQAAADKVKNDFLFFLLEAKQHDKTVAAYGAAAKGNTLMNYAGIRLDLISFVVDRNPSKQGKFMPGSRIPIVDEQYLKRIKPDYIVVLPWNLKSEITHQLNYIRDWDGKIVTAVPRLEIS